MYNRELTAEIIRNIIWAIEQITKRFQAIETSEDFIKDDQGLEKIDSICMQLINIGEALKEIDKLTEGKLLVKYPAVDWKKAKGMRDIITHHYFDIDAEIVFTVCSEHLPEMKSVLERILLEIEENIGNEP